MIVNERGSLFTATYFPTHYGHEKKLCHLTLASSERQQIAGKLLQGVPPSRILQDIRASLTSDVERVHLTSRQDISNVKNLFGITVSGTSEVVQTRMSDATSVHAWVQSCQALGSTNPVLLHKQQGEEFAGLHKDDFALLIMTPVQKLMLEKFGNDRICVDSTHGMTGHDFELTSVLVIDEFEEGFPSVFLLSSCTDARTLAVCLQRLKEVVGSFRPLVFMSDDAPAFYNAWSSVMGPVDKCLLCTWHVDRAWNGKLCSVRDAEKRANVYKALRACHTQLDTNKFNTCLTNLLEQLSTDEETKTFGEYFATTYGNRPEMWAYCHRKGARINTNMHLEQFHSEIKHCYLEGKKVKRVDKSVEALLTFVQNRQFSRITKLHKRKLSRKVATIHHYHNLGLTAVSMCKNIGDGHWEVVGEKGVTFSVHHVSDHMCNSSCVMVCKICKCCMSNMSCTCVDYAIHGKMCTHIHAACLRQREDEEVHANISEPVTESQQVRETETEMTFHQNDIQRQSKPPHNTQADTIQKLTNEINSLVTTCNNNSLSNSSDLVHSTMNGVIEHLKSAKRLLEIYGQEVPAYPVIENTSQPVNKLMTPQKRYYSVRKKRTSKKLSLQKPSVNEAGQLEDILLEKDLLINTGDLDHDYETIPKVSSENIQRSRGWFQLHLYMALIV